MLARLELSVTKGCDGVDPDNVKGYDNDNGLGLTQGSALNYVNFLADAAYVRNLAIGLKNGGDIVPHIVDKMEWSVQEQCIQYGECDFCRPTRQSSMLSASRGPSSLNQPILLSRSCGSSGLVGLGCHAGGAGAAR